ncbi:MAG: hypothetical protein ACXW4E_08585 [Anaerolineales bacterium]
MTKVRLSTSILEFRQGMAELVNEVCEENAIPEEERETDPDFIIPRTEVAELGIPGLLRPPKVEMIWPDLYLRNGHLDGITQIHTSEYFGVMDVYVTLEDDQGNHIEGDFAMENEYVKNHWGYIASAAVSPGTTIIMRVIALDCLGGVAIQQETVTV